MTKDAPLPERLLLTLGPGILGISLVLLVMLPPSLLKGLTGTQAILYGSGLFLLGMVLGWWRGVSGEPSQTGHTSNSQVDFLSHRTTKHVQS